MVPIKLFKRKRASYKRRVGYKSIKDRLKKAALIFGAIFMSHVTLFWIFEPVNFFNSIWHTYTIMTTVGFGDIYATTNEGKVVTMLFGFSLGIWLLANLAAIFIDLVTERTRQKTLGNWRWKLNKPIVLIGSPRKDAEPYFLNLLNQIRSTAGLSDKDILIVSRQFKEGLPESIADLGAVLLNKKPDDKSLYEDPCIKNAAIIYIIAKEESNGISNAITYNVLSLLSENNIHTKVIAETTKDCDRSRFARMGADAIIRPIRAYPEMVVRAMINPLNAKFIENMFSSEGDEPVVCPVEFSGSWSAIAITCIENDLGNPVGYVNKDNELIGNPIGSDIIEAAGIQLLVKGNTEDFLAKIYSTLNNL